MWIPVVFVVWLQIPVDVHDRLDGIERVHACMHGPAQCDTVYSARLISGKLISARNRISSV
jgi:hypothetical protein